MMLAYKGFILTLIPAAIGGALWSALGLPLGWLMGSAIITGFISFYGPNITLPKIIYRPSLAVIGAGVGLTITPDVAVKIVQWFPLMALMGFSGVVLALLLTPFVARKGDMAYSTAFFSLMPGGVIEMANIGEPHGADRTTIATLHAIRVALVVGILPLGLYLIFPSTGLISDTKLLSMPDLAMVVVVALLGGYFGMRWRLPAAWLLGALLSVAAFTASGGVDGQIAEPLMAVAQIIVGMSLGAKFEKEKLQRLPRAMAFGTIALGFIIMVMALIAILFSRFLPIQAPELVLAFSIGGLAEMVLTARYLELDMAIVAAFQATRAVLVNSFAGVIWNKFHKRLQKGDN